MPSIKVGRRVTFAEWVSIRMLCFAVFVFPQSELGVLQSMNWSIPVHVMVRGLNESLGAALDIPARHA